MLHKKAGVIYADALLKILSLYLGRLGYKLVDTLAYLLRTARRCTMFVVMLLKKENGFTRPLPIWKSLRE